MSTRTISITDEAYDRLKSLKKNEKMSFSDVIIEHFPRRRNLSEVLEGIGANPDFADAVERAQKEMRSRSMRKVRF